MLTETWFSNLEKNIPEDIRFAEGRILRQRPDFEDGIDFKLERPFSSLGSDQIIKAVAFALERNWPAIEIATLLSEEAKSRKPKVQRQVDMLFRDMGVEPISWLAQARRSINSVSYSYRSRGATASNYFVLLNRDGEYECYVGQTATTNLLSFNSRQEARIAQHFCNIRASSHVKNHGYEPLWSLNCFTEKVRYANRVQAETQYNISLSDLGIKVRGDRQTFNGEKQDQTQ